MPQIDRLFASMVQRGATRSILTGGQPLQMMVGQQTVSGAALTDEMLQSMIAEVVPPDQQAQLAASGQTELYYPAPQGTMRLWVSRHEGTTTLVIDQMPNPVAPPPPQIPQAPTQNPYGGGAYGGNEMHNSSGSGAMAQVPPEVQGRWNWGAFLLGWIWGIGNNTWIAMLCFVPCVGLVMPFVLGAKGNEWAWRNRRFGGVDDFKKVQTSWGWAGLIVQCLVVLPLTFIIFAAILAPAGTRARFTAQRSSSQSNLKQIGLGVMQFSQDNNETMPPGRTAAEWKTSIMPYVKSGALFVSPSTDLPYSVNPALAGVSLARIDSPADTPMFYEAKADSLGGHNIGFADGHVKWFGESSWPTFRTYLDSVGAE